MNIRSKLGVATVAAALAFAGAASAATFIDTWTTNTTTGAISVVIGDTGLGVAGGSSSSQGVSTQSYNPSTTDFTDTFNFTLPTGTVGSSVTSSDTKNNLVFTGFTFNGVSGMIGPTPAGLPSAGITAQFVTSGHQQELIVKGSGGPAASFGGTVNFAPIAGGVPEPASWALMIIGFGSAGALLRRRRSMLVAA
ncbi:FxDxF family PEP-CTERM protein [Phenylobacterium sp.]|uniref:FxDxF family PEP-CTERM protein n=1 Tax=Phenylobacterium sp. TaxID=1871053 RepID=UPI002CB3BB7C|nr:FxDxF family PEP-CTERM protein [Phenylobacterium sp.]HLZ75934.1 FxDxF family PEP-CTERM protein [Phenylobacterium sp.]